MRSTISVAMCTFNGARFLPEQLKSIAMQSRLPDELVVCDDRSSDGTSEILTSFAKRAPFPVQLHINEKNVGSTRNCEKAISLCRGEIIALADQDDIWYEQKLQELERYFLVSNTTVAAFSDADILNDDSASCNERLWKSVRFSDDEQQSFAEGGGWAVLIKHPVVTGATMAFRRDACRIFLPIPDQITHDRWMSFFFAVAGFVALVPQPLMGYRKHGDQQIGLGPQGIEQRVHQARLRGERFYAQEIELLHLISDRLKHLRNSLPFAEAVLEEIHKKIGHLENRLRLRRKLVDRVPEVLREVWNRGYWKYSAGWESVAKDLFLPGIR